MWKILEQNVMLLQLDGNEIKAIKYKMFLLEN